MSRGMPYLHAMQPRRAARHDPAIPVDKRREGNPQRRSRTSVRLAAARRMCASCADTVDLIKMSMI